MTRGSGDRREFQTVVLAALLHDLGPFLRYAGQECRQTRQHEQNRHDGLHRRCAQRTDSENLVEPFPAGPSQVTVTWRVPPSGNVIVPT